MKKTKVIIPALGILLLSTAASVTGTVAWFSMNAQVTASGMNVKAKAENGIVIANTNSTNDADWKSSATALYNGANAELLPTSTADASKWWHANSDSVDSHVQTSGYTELTELVDGDTKDGAYGKNGNDYYLLNSFFIKSSGAAFAAPLYVNKLTVTGNTSSVDLDKSLRVLAQYGSNSLIFAPFDGATLSYKVGGATENTTAFDAYTNPVVNKQFGTADINIPLYDGTNALEVKVYVYFEGEDANCKSANITETLDKLTLEVIFGTKTL